MEERKDFGNSCWIEIMIIALWDAALKEMEKREN